MQWEIGTLHVLPNGKLCIYDITSTVYEGGLNVEAVTVDVVLSKLLEKKIQLKELRITRPSVQLTEKDLIAILHVQTSKGSDIPEPTELASNNIAEEQIPEVAANENVNQADEGELASPVVASNEVVDSSRKIEVQPSGELIVPEVQLEDEREAWIHVEDASFSLALGEKVLTSLDGLSADVPIGGRSLTGSVKWGEITLAGRRIVDQGEFLINKENHILSVKQTDVNFFGLDLKPELLLVKGGRSGLLFQADLEVPEQSARELMTHLNLTVGMAVESVFGRMRLVGDPAHPLTWRALADVRAKNIEVAEAHRGGYSRFDHFQFQSLLQRGVMQVPRMELIGDDASVMSNGVLTMNGYGFGICRFVVSGEKSEWVNKIQGGYQMVQGVSGGLMRPFETSDVYYMDVEVDGSVLNPMMRVANVSDWQPLWDAVMRLREFVQNERLEELTRGQR